MAVALPAELSSWLEQERLLVDRGALHPDCRSRLHPVPRGAVRGVVLLLHGFTAGPWQYDELGPVLAEAGLLGFAARLVGHGTTVPGASGPEESPADLPRAREVQRFVDWGERALALAQGLAEQHGVPLSLVGMSAGGAMALDLLRIPGVRVQRALLVAPLVLPKQWWLRAFVRVLGALPFGAWLADRWRLSFATPAPRADGWRRPGHQRFFLGNVMALFAYARLVRGERGAKLAAPVQLVATASDDRVSLPACRRLADSEGARHALYVFARERAVPHAMLTAWENPDAPSRQILFAIARDFLLHGTAHRRA